MWGSSHGTANRLALALLFVRQRCSTPCAIWNGLKRHTDNRQLLFYEIRHDQLFFSPSIVLIALICWIIFWYSFVFTPHLCHPIVYAAHTKRRECVCLLMNNEKKSVLWRETPTLTDSYNSVTPKAGISKMSKFKTKCSTASRPETPTTAICVQNHRHAKCEEYICSSLIDDLKGQSTEGIIRDVSL